MAQIKISKTIEEFLNLCGNAKQKYDFNIGIVDGFNAKTTDYLHDLEIKDLSYREFCKLTTQQRRNLDERRCAKDIVEDLEPLKEYLDTSEGKRAYNMLGQVLGKVRKAEQYHENRVYIRRFKGE